MCPGILTEDEMTGVALKKKLVAMYGRRFHRPVAEETNMNLVTIYRWCASKKVPGIVAAWITEKAEANRLRPCVDPHA